MFGGSAGRVRREAAKHDLRLDVASQLVQKRLVPPGLVTIGQDQHAGFVHTGKRQPDVRSGQTSTLRVVDAYKYTFGGS